MAKSKKKQSQENAQIKMFLEECFERYSMKYSWFFFKDNDNGDRKPLPLFTNGVISEKILHRSAEILGMMPNDILSRNEDAAYRWYRKYPFFAQLNHFNSLRTRSFYGEGVVVAQLINAIFRDNRCKYPERYDTSDVRARMMDMLKKADSYLPGIYHKEAEIISFYFETEQFFSYPWIEEMVNSFINLIERIKELFFKAWHEELDEQEILEYNFLVTFLDLIDNGGRQPIYYEGLKRLIPLYREEGYVGNTEEFYSLVHFKFVYGFQPWACKEFADNAALAQRYVSIYPYAKHRMFEFGRAVKYFACSFKWSDSQTATCESDDEALEQILTMTQEEFEQEMEQETVAIETYEKIGVSEVGGWMRVRVPKSTAELNGDELYAEKLIRLGGVPSKGGLRIHNIPSIQLNTKEQLDRALLHRSVLKEVLND